MPIALLLTETTAAFRWGERQLDPWTKVVEIEELLIDRARSAFLFRWFGLALPLQGFHVRVVIENLEELKRRYREVKRATPGDARGPNLTESLRGIAGTLAGVLLTPGVALGTSIALTRKKVVPWALGLLLIALSTVAGAVIATLAPALGVASILSDVELVAQGDPGVRGLFDLLGALALLTIAARRFLGLLLGPRSAVKNPVLLDVLNLADGLARLVPFALAIVAVVVTRLGPLLLPLAAQVQPFLALLGAAGDVLGFMAKDMLDHLVDALTSDDGLFGVLGRAFRRLAGPLPGLLQALGWFFDRGAELLLAWWEEVQRRMTAFGTGLGTQLTGVLGRHPVAERWGRLTAALSLAIDVFRRSKPAKAAKASGPTPFDPWIAKAKLWGAQVAPTFEGFPGVPKLEGPGAFIDRLGLKAAHGIPADVAARAKELTAGLAPVDAGVAAYVERARHPSSAFAQEERALAQELGAKTPAAALAAAHERELQLRALVEVVVGRVLPPDLRRHMGPLLDALEAADEQLSLDPKKKAGGRRPAARAGRKPERPRIDFPVLDLPEPDSGLLRPVVHRLVVRGRGAARDELRTFADRLRPLLDRPYPASA